MTDTPTTGWRKRWQRLPTWLRVAAYVLVALVLFASCSTGEPEGSGDRVVPDSVETQADPAPALDPEPAPEPAPVEDQASIDVACRHAFNVADDAAAGVLTIEETRDKWREVHDSLQYTRIAPQSERVMADLTAMTQGDMSSLDDGSFEDHVVAVNDRCNALMSP